MKQVPLEDPVNKMLNEIVDKKRKDNPLEPMNKKICVAALIVKEHKRIYKGKG